MLLKVCYPQRILKTHGNLVHQAHRTRLSAMLTARQCHGSASAVTNTSRPLPVVQIMIIIVFCSGYWTAERSDAKLFRIRSIRVHKCIEGSKSFNFFNFTRSFATRLKMAIAQPKTFSIRLFKKWEVPSGRTCQSDKVKIIRTGLNSVDRSA